MHRRDFLRMRVSPEGRILELSCRALHLRIINAQFMAASVADGEGGESGSEPPTLHDHASIDQIVNEVDAQMRDADVVHLVEDEWMAAPALREQFDPLLGAFVARGGRLLR